MRDQREAAMTEIRQRFVAHIDMLGMSELTVRDPQLAWNALSKLAQARNEIFRMRIELTQTGDIIKDRLAVITFSDTIVVFTQSDEDADLYAIVLMCDELVSRSLSYSIPLRAGIAYGSFLFNFDESMFAGPALVEAYRTGEAAQWIGIVLDAEVAARARRLPLESDRRRPLVVEWDVPIKPSGRQRRWVVDWPESHRRNFTVPLPISPQTFYIAFQQLFGPWDRLPNKVRRKYENTVGFVNARISGLDV